MAKIRFFEKQDLKSLSVLSKMFVEENCCNNILETSEEEFLQKTVVVACENDKIVGYLYGSQKKQEKTTSYLNANEWYYEIKEIYILPEFRNLGIGEKMVKFIEEYAKQKECKAIELCAVSKNYNLLLNFYINKLNMKFISAFLVKPIE